MPSRLGHLKSRHGCKRCKTRRVKCDEMAPCRNCVRRKETCSLQVDISEQSQIADADSLAPMTLRCSPFAAYPYPSSITDVDPTSFLSSLAHHPHGAKHASQDTWGQDLFLMNYFATKTVFTLSCRSNMLHLWQDVIPEDAAGRPFLLHAMLAFASLHLASQRVEKRHVYEQRSRQLQNQAISEYLEELEAISYESSGPIFAMAYLVAMMSMAAISDNGLQREESEEHRPAHELVMKDILAVFTVIRGMRTVMDLNPDTPRFKSGPYGFVFQGYKPQFNFEFSLPGEARDRYEALRTKMLDHFVSDAGERKALTDAIDTLEMTHHDALCMAVEAATVDVEPASLMKWVAIVPAEYVDMVRCRSTPALIVLGEFAKVFGIAKERWFLARWSENALEAIRISIEPAGRAWLPAGPEKTCPRIAKIDGG